MKRLLRTAVFVLFSVALALSQTAVVRRNVNLRPDPSTNGTPIDKLTPPTQLQLLETAATNGFLHVKVNGESGWVWSRNVRVQQAPSGGGGETPGGGGAATAISPGWDKPAPQTASFESDEAHVEKPETEAIQTQTGVRTAPICQVPSIGHMGR